MTLVEARACRAIILDPSGLTVLGHAERLRPAGTPHLLAYLATITDPRARAGRRHPPPAILALAAAAVLAGARSVTAIAEWAADAPRPVRAALGTRRDPFTGRWAVPTETTIRRTLARLDAEALAAAVGGWLGDCERASQRRRAVAVDGKTLGGARRDGHPTPPARCGATTPPVRCSPNARSTVPQVRCPACQSLLDGLDLGGVVVTTDALHTHADAAEFLVACKQAHYLFCVKANQPRCWPAAPPWPGPTSRAGPHPRPRPRPRRAAQPQRRDGAPLRVPARLPGHPGHTRRARDLRARRWRPVVVYAITSLTSGRPAPPGWLTTSGATGRSGTAWTTSAMSPSPAIWRSVCSAAPGRSSSPLPSATPRWRPPPDPSPASGSPSDESDFTTERRSPALALGCRGSGVPRGDPGSRQGPSLRRWPTLLRGHRAPRSAGPGRPRRGRPHRRWTGPGVGHDEDGDVYFAMPALRQVPGDSRASGPSGDARARGAAD
jgi:hypothetical protein